MTPILIHRIFEPSAEGHGGNHRALQLQELYDKYGLELHPMEAKRRTFIPCYIRALILILQTHGWRILLRPRSAWRYYKMMVTEYYDRYRQFLDNDIDTLIIEATGEYFHPLFVLAKRANKRIIAIPHNLESLVPNRLYLTAKHGGIHPFEQEIRMLRLCEKVYCISEEETWLLRLWGINADYLPYLPPKALLPQIDDIRKARSLRNSNLQKRIFLLGSAINEPTRRGMQEIMRFWEEASTEATLVIGGFATDTLLRNNLQKDNIVILGALSDSQIKSELISCDAILIHQIPTTGALTRIAEALEAGIPIIANFDAARSYHHNKNLHEYKSIQDLINIINYL